MKIIRTKKSINHFLDKKRSKNLCIGFVPTMGALHSGHSSLIEKAKNECDLVIVSIFVNPKQFNNSNDFKHYPIKTNEDINLLNSLAVDVLFLPKVEEVYSQEFVMPNYTIGALDSIMEGKFRPGHFNGVVEVVYRLFSIIRPQKAYFGLKDFQQLAIIKKMSEEMHLHVEIIPCDTLREKDGLALSSRNLRLNEEERKNALFIYQTLKEIQKIYMKFKPIELKKKMTELFKNSPLKLEYIEFIDSSSFEVLEENWTDFSIACIAAYAGEVRLIDNMSVNKRTLLDK
ncbi:MAG: pantoate--beta-alanine ligase [Flavobacteriia bacterium]|nr:pantoate--beta-alanine ligase [Flavobacteriia bacterium]